MQIKLVDLKLDIMNLICDLCHTYLEIIMTCQFINREGTDLFIGKYLPIYIWKY